MTNELLEERKKNLELFLLKILHHRAFSADQLTANFYDERILDFGELCPVDKGVMKMATDLKDSMTDNISFAKNYLTGWFSTKKQEIQVEETEYGESVGNNEKD